MAHLISISRMQVQEQIKNPIGCPLLKDNSIFSCACICHNHRFLTEHNNTLQYSVQHDKDCYLSLFIKGA
jgi:hypothetical protein